MAVESAFVPVVVPGAALDDVVRRLGERGLVGEAIDGSRLGLHDVVVARVVGDDERAWVLHEPDGERGSVDLAELGAELTDRWPGTLVGAAVFDRYDLFDPVLASAGLPQASVAVTPRTNLTLGAFASASGTTFHEALVDDRLVIGVEQLLGPSLDVLVDALVNAKGRSVVLWRVGDHVALHAMRRGRHVAAHVWTPPWTTIGHPDLGDLRDPRLDGDADVFGDVLRLSPEQVEGLRGEMLREVPDLVALARLLDLPPMVVDVLEHRTAVAAAPGVVTIEPKPWKDELKRSLGPSEHDPAWMRTVDRARRDPGPVYLVTRTLLLVLGLFLVLGSLDGGGSIVWGSVGLVLSGGALGDRCIRWYRKRRGAGGI